jgi:hypothetical protein
MRINLHIPHFARHDPGSGLARLYRRLTAALLAREGAVLTVSARAFRPHQIGPDAFTLNYHTCFTRARNLNLKLGYLPGFLYADRTGYSGWSEIARHAFDPATIDAARAEAFLATRIEAQVLSRGLSKEPQARSGAARSLPSGYTLLALQVPRDAVLRLADLTVGQMLVPLLSRAADQPLVLKLHPATRDPAFAARIRALHDPPRGVHVVDDHIHDLIRGAARVVTVNSGTGFEALMLGRPVIACGASDYHHLTQRARTADDLAAALDRTLPAPDRPTLARYALWYAAQQIDVTAPGWEDRILAKLQAAPGP